MSYAAYQRDRLDCANQTYGLDISLQPETVQALSALNNASLYAFINSGALYGGGGETYRDGNAGYQAAISVIEPDHTTFRSTTYTSLFRNAARTDVTDQLQAVLDHCLRSRGYQPFRLTADQRRALSGYRKGSEARSRYLYSLGNDPSVLSDQAI